MTAKSSKELNDKVWVLHKDKIQQLTIVQITIIFGSVFGLTSQQLRERFGLCDESMNYVTDLFAEKCFTTKEELIQSIT